MKSRAHLSQRLLEGKKVNPYQLAGVVLVAALAGCGGSSSSSGSSAGQSAIVMSPANGTALPNATVGQVYSQTFTVVSGGTAPYFLTPTGVPPGLSWTTTSSSGTLSGTPTQVGTATFEVTITDATSSQAQVGYPLTIQAANGQLTITPATIPGATVGSAYNVTIEVLGGTPPYAFTTQGNLPPGITLGPTGTNGMAAFSGTPVASGTYNFTVRVTDAASPQGSGSVAYSIAIP